jgi:hypothetical protein
MKMQFGQILKLQNPASLMTQPSFKTKRTLKEILTCNKEAEFSKRSDSYKVINKN